MKKSGIRYAGTYFLEKEESSLGPKINKIVYLTSSQEVNEGARRQPFNCNEFCK